MVIGACGYAATGSGAVYDFLKEFDEIQYGNDSEFKYVYKVDGLQDLEYHLTKQYNKGASGDMAIARFLKGMKFAYVPFVKKPAPRKEYLKLTKEYVNEIVQGTFLGMENVDYEACSVMKGIIVLGFKKFIIPFYEKIFRHPYNIWPIRRIYISIFPANFMEASKKYMRNILLSMGFDLDGKILLNQPFEGNAPENSMKYFDNPKAIIMDRDPRDIYIAHQKIYYGEGRHMPRNDVKTFVIQYRQVRLNQLRNNTDEILFLNFEDFIYNYEKCKEEIMSFLDLKEHTSPKKFFDPAKSKNNIQLYKKYPEFEEEVRYIEKELPEYIYPFEKYGDIKHDGRTF